MKGYLVALAVAGLVGCRTAPAAQESDELRERAGGIGVALDEAIDRAGQRASEEQRIRELARLSRWSNMLGRARLIGYMSYIDGDMDGFKKAQADLGEIELALGLGK
ncbi:MAG: hypothetical protein ACE5JG_05975 [Planctomycetota bacterium]